MSNHPATRQHGLSTSGASFSKVDGSGPSGSLSSDILDWGSSPRTPARRRNTPTIPRTSPADLLNRPRPLAFCSEPLVTKLLPSTPTSPPPASPPHPRAAHTAALSF